MKDFKYLLSSRLIRPLPRTVKPTGPHRAGKVSTASPIKESDEYFIKESGEYLITKADKYRTASKRRTDKVQESFEKARKGAGIFGLRNAGQ
jgi:hypothetical protein